MVQSCTTTRRRTRLQRIFAVVAAIILFQVGINYRTSSSRAATPVPGAGHGSLEGKLDDFYYKTKTKWAPTSATLSNNIDMMTSDTQEAAFVRNGGIISDLSENVDVDSESLSTSVPLKKITVNRNISESVTPEVWSNAAEHKGVMEAMALALAERYPDYLNAGKLVMVTVANEAFQELLMNWLAFTLAYDMPLMVGALDDATMERCRQMSVPVVQLQHAGFDTTLISLDEHAVKNKDFRSSQRGFQNYGVRKLAFLLTLLELGLDVSLSDTDVVWKKRYVAPIASKYSSGGGDNGEILTKLSSTAPSTCFQEKAAHIRMLRMFWLRPIVSRKT
jgi:hypothetical protein